MPGQGCFITFKVKMHTQDGIIHTPECTYQVIKNNIIVYAKMFTVKATNTYVTVCNFHYYHKKDSILLHIIT